MDSLRWSPEIAGARREGTPIVGLETSVLAQGLPDPANRQAAADMAAAVVRAGAVAAFTAVVRGAPALGLTTDELERFLSRDGISKASARDLPVVMHRGADAATTVAAALAICAAGEVPVFATGGIGGVHRDAPYDESADLAELSRRSVITVCSGAKAILDLAATVERLESLGVTLVGFQTTELPGFYSGSTGIPLPASVGEVRDVVGIFVRQRALGLPGALLVVQQPPPNVALTRVEAEKALTTALAEAKAGGVSGPALTPFLLSAMERLTSGRSLRANLALLEVNARLAGEIAVELARTAPFR